MTESIALVPSQAELKHDNAVAVSADDDVKTKDIDTEGPIPINGWDDDQRLLNKNPPGMQCYKQEAFVESMDYDKSRKCTHVEEESCGLFYRTKFKSSEVVTRQQLSEHGCNIWF